VTTLLNAGLLDELRLIVHPLLLAGGKPLFAGLDGVRRLELRGVETAKSGRVVLTYRGAA
jgi:dihydrofolate reductase